MASFVADMQTMEDTTHSNVTVSNSNTTATAASSNNNKPATNQAAIIQTVQGGSSYIVTIAEPGSGDQGIQDTVQIQQAGSNQVVYNTGSQYSDGDNANTIYPSSNGQMQNYSGDYNQTSMYTPTYYQGSPSNSQLGGGSGGAGGGITQVGGVQGQLLTQHGTTYQLVHQAGTIDGEGQPLTHTTRASPVTVQWLIDNYETAEGVSLPRSTLYNHYLRHCQEQKMDPMNPASFGKLIRSVFLGLRTRRLGTRGNSKYHYYGIRIKASSPLNQFPDEQTLAIRQKPMGSRLKSEGRDGYYDISENQQHQQFLGDASTALPSFGHIEIDESTVLPAGVTMELVRTFEYMYQEHCEAILDVVVNMQFALIEALWQAFWRNLTPDQAHNAETAERRLPRKDLYAVCKLECTRDYVRKCDYAFYHALVEVLIPDVLRPIPSSLTQAVRNFAKSLEGWLKGAMDGAPEDMIKTKTHAVCAFAQTLRRYTSLNHLAQAARAVLQNTSQINQMLTDLNRVDFANVQEQASWVCQCDDDVVTQLEQDFKNTLQQQNTLEQWSVWLETVVTKVLKPHEGKPSFPTAARQFLLKWSFYSSMVIRDLTLRSAASFGSFHLIRLLYDEYMFYLVERKVAIATGETPIAVMGEMRGIELETDSPPPPKVTATLPTINAREPINVIPLTTVLPVSTTQPQVGQSIVRAATVPHATSGATTINNHTAVQVINATTPARTTLQPTTLQKVTLMNNGNTSQPITVVASSSTPGQPKTYHVVMPVNNNAAASGGSDTTTASNQPPAKKLKATDFDSVQPVKLM